MSSSWQSFYLLQLANERGVAVCLFSCFTMFECTEYHRCWQCRFVLVQAMEEEAEDAETNGGGAEAVAHVAFARVHRSCHSMAL